MCILEICLQHSTTGGFEADQVTGRSWPSQESLDSVDGLRGKAEKFPDEAPVRALGDGLFVIIYIYCMIYLEIKKEQACYFWKGGCCSSDK